MAARKPATVIAHAGINEALMAVQLAAPALQKDAINPHFKNTYISLDSLLPQILPVLQENGLLLTQQMDSVGNQPSLRTRLTHVTSGEWTEGNCVMELAKADPQGVGSAVTYYRRYSLMSVLGLIADKDDDAQKAIAAKPKPAALPVPQGIESAAFADDGNSVAANPFGGGL